MERNITQSPLTEFLLTRILIGIFLLTCFAVPLRSQCSLDYSTTNNFCDLDSLYLHANPTGGTGPFTFLWETGETTQTISIPLAFGDYMVTMTDATGCVAIINCHIKPFPPVLYYPYNQNACEGDVVTLFLEWFRDSIPGATYLWSTGETTPTITLTNDLVWSVTVTDPNTGCEFIIPEGLFDFHETNKPEIVGPDILCNGQTVTLSVAGGPFGTIYWYPDDVYQPTLDVSAPGTYIVWASSVDAGYCWELDTIVIGTGDIEPPILDGPPELCSGQSGIVSVTNSNLYTQFSWSNGITTSSWNATSAGIYGVTVTNSNGCTASASITIDNNPGPQGVLTSSNATCGQSNGFIDLTMDPPTNYNYLWSNGMNTQDIGNLAPGSYSVTVTDAGGCTNVYTSSINDQPIAITINEVITPNTSCTQVNGAISLTISPAGAYTYAWSNGMASEDISGLAPGNYTVTVSTGVNCSASETYVVTDNSNAAEVSANVVPSTCGLLNGSITLVLNGGTGPFTYLWSNGNTGNQITDVAAGPYSVTVTGADGCATVYTDQVPDDIIQIEIASIVNSNTSCGNGNGSIELTVTPANSYLFAWSNGMNTEDIFNLNAGIYTVTVTLGNTCNQTADFTVNNENIPFSIGGTTSPNTSCQSSNGMIDLQISPAGTYTFAWSTGDDTEDIQSLTQGNYTVTVTNIDGCAITSVFTIVDQLPVIVLTGVTSPNTSCSNPNGTVDVSISPIGAYAYSWSNGSTNEDLSGLGQGSYSVTVTSADGCTSSGSFFIVDQTTLITVTGTSIANTSCLTPNGSIDITVNPIGGYVFNWSNGSTTEDLQNVGAGNYQVTVTDVNQCSTLASYTIDNNTSPVTWSAIIQNETCLSGNGAIDLVVTPANNTYQWSNGASTEDIQAIGFGDFIVTITNSNGCAYIDTFTVANDNSNFSTNGITTNNSSCVTPNGVIDLSISPAGQYTFNWSTGDNTEDLVSLLPGIYSVTITDVAQCASIASFTIDNNTIDPVIAEIITPAKCGSPNGAIDVSIGQTTGNSFLWSTGSSTEDLSNVAAGNYAITVTAPNGCSAVASFTVPDSSTAMTINAATTDVTNCTIANGAVDIQILPQGNYSYSWSNGSITEDLTAVGAGSYTITITDRFGCTATSSVIITDLSTAPLIAEVITPATCGKANGGIDIAITPSGPYTFNWSNGLSTEDITGILPGNYSVTVTAINGCSATANYTVTNQNSNFTIQAVTTDNSSCKVVNGSIDLSITPSGNYSFNWSSGATTEDIIQLSPGIYQVTVTDLSQCESTASFTILDITNPPTLTGEITQPKCGAQNGSINIDVLPVGQYGYAWSNNIRVEDLQNVSPGIYTVTVTDVNGCTASSAFTLNPSNAVGVQISANLSSPGENIYTCTLQINKPLTEILSIDWSPDAILSCQTNMCMEQTFTVVDEMEISVRVVDINGCEDNDVLMLRAQEIVDYEVYIPNVFTPDNSGTNDRFTIYGNEEIEEIELLEIFDRWGNKVWVNSHFPPNDENYGWDGMFRNELMNPAVFAYRALVRYSNGDVHPFKGDVTLVR